MDFVSFGEEVRKRRTEEQMSQENLAQQVGVSRVYISLIERGQAQNLSWSVVSKLSTVLGISMKADADTVVSDTLTEDEQRRMPKSLKEFITTSKQPVPIEDQRMLMNLEYRGKQPTTEEEWRLLYNMIRSIIKE